MSKQIEAMKLVLEGLEQFCETGAMLRPIEKRDALREALAEQPAQPQHAKQEFIDKLNEAFSPLARNHYKWEGWPGTNSFALAAWDAVGAALAEQPAQQQGPVAPSKEYTMGDWFNDLENPHANR